MNIIKTYCKPSSCNIEDINFIKVPIHLAFTGKMRNPKFQKLLIDNKLMSQEQIDYDLNINDYTYITEAIDKYSEIILEHIKNRNIQLEPLKHFTIKEGHKIRDISEESAE